MYVFTIHEIGSPDFPVTLTRILTCRSAGATVIGITDSDRSQIPLVTSLLAVAKKGCNYLSSIRKTSEIEIVTKTADYRMLGNDAKKQFELTLCADRIFCISRGEPADNIFTQSPFILC